jgi:hypothetical protein
MRTGRRIYHLGIGPLLLCAIAAQGCVGEERRERTEKVGQQAADVRGSEAVDLRVIDDDNPIEGVRVAVAGPPGPDMGSIPADGRNNLQVRYRLRDDYSARTDSHGRASMKTSGHQVPYAYLWSATHVPTEVALVRDGGEIEARMLRYGSLRGVVAFADGTPIAHPLLTIEHVDHAPGGPIWVRNPLLADEGGRFEYTRLIPGRYRLNACTCDETPVAIPFTVSPVFDVGDAEVVFEVRPGRDFTGTVVDPSGNGVGALLQVALPGVPSWQLPKAQTDADGTFRLQGLGAGPFALDIRVAEWGAAGLQSLFVRREFRSVPKESIEIRIGEGLSISGTLTTPGGKPVAGLRLDVVPIGTDVPWWRYPRRWSTTTTDSQGRFWIDGLEPGAYDIRCIVSRHSNKGGPDPEIENGKAVAAGESGVKLVFASMGWRILQGVEIPQDD